MNKFLFLIISLLLLTTSTLAQNDKGTIYGEIRDSKGALTGASIFLIRDMSTQEIIKYTVSESNGKFLMNAPLGEYTLGVSFLGYSIHSQKININADKNDLGIITLQESTQELQTIVVQGRAVKVRTQPDGFIVNVKDMRERTNDALDLLKLIPKIQIKGEQISVIGKDKVLIKIGNVLQRVESSEVASVLKGYDSGLIDRVEVITQPPLRYDPDGNTAMIVLHTSNIFKEYMGGVIGTEEMWASKKDYRYGGYGSLLYNHKGVFASIAPSINFNGSKYLEQQEYQNQQRTYKVYTPSSGKYNYRGVRGNIQYEYSEKDFIGLAFAWNRKSYDNKFESKEITSLLQDNERVVDNQNRYKSAEPRFTATAYWETAFGKFGNKAWAELSYFNLTNDSKTEYEGREQNVQFPFLEYIENNDINTSGINFNNDYSIYLDANRKYLLETGVKSSWSSTTNYRTHYDIKSLSSAIMQKNDIKWNEFIITPYISSTLRFNKQWWMRLGLRYDGTKSNLRQTDKSKTNIPEVSMYNDALLPTLHASYRPSPIHQFTLTFNSSIERPKFKDLNPFEWQINENSFYRGNTNLHPQRYYTTGLGYTFMSSLSIRGRLKKGIDLITGISTMQDEKVYTQMENAQNSLFFGVEAGYYFEKLSWMNASIDVFYGRNKYTSNKQYLLSESKGNEWGLNGYIDFTFNKNRTWTGYISGDYNGRKRTTVANIDPQYSLEMGTTYFLMNRRLALSLAGMNLISSRHKGVSYRNGYSITFNNRYNYPTLFLSASYKFSNAKDKSSSRTTRATHDIERRF